MSDEFADFPFSSTHRMVITTAIPYHWRWQVNQIKLMLIDLKYLQEKCEIVEAGALYEIVKDEAEQLFYKMRQEIAAKVKQREKVSE